MTNRICLGQRNNGDYGFFASPAGVDATTANDGDLLFSTQYAHGPIVHTKGTTGVLNNSTYTTVTFPSLGYVPMAMVGYYHPDTGHYYYYQREEAATYSYSPSGSNFAISGRNGPRVIITASSISLKSWGTTALNGHFTIFRIPGGS